MQYLKDYFKFLYWFIGYHLIQFASEEIKIKFYNKQYESFKRKFGGSIFIGDYEKEWFYICTNSKVDLFFMYYPIIKKEDVFYIDESFVNDLETFDIKDGHIAQINHLPKLLKNKHICTSVAYDSNDRVFHYLKYINDRVIGTDLLVKENIVHVVKRLFYKRTIFPYCFDGKMIIYFRRTDNE